MTPRQSKAKLREIIKAMEDFPQEVKRQERAFRAELKVRKAFGQISIHPRIRATKLKSK